MKYFCAIKCISLLIFGISAIPGFTQSLAPSTINSTGGSSTLNGKTFEYSIGEMALIHTASNANIIVTQGVLQPADIETSISDQLLTDGQLLVYPNPTRDILNVDVNLPTGGTLNLNLYDLNGKLVSQKEITFFSGKETTSLSLDHLSSGNYMLNAVFKTGTKISHQSFKIQKMN